MSDIKLYNDDCLSVMKDMDADSVDLIVTDPPYNIGKFMISRNTNMKRLRENFFVSAGWDNMEFDEWYEMMDRFFESAANVMKVGGSVIMFMSVMKVQTIIELAEKHGFYYKTTGIWHKTNPMPKNMNLHFVNSCEEWIYFVYKKRTGTFNNDGKLIHDFYECGVASSSERTYGKHPTQKPLELMNHFIKILSNPDDVVLDPFMGSGTTGVSAKYLGRSFVGIELNDDYFQMAKQRIEE